MKRIIKLKGELILFSLLAMFLAMVLGSMFSNKAKNVDIRGKAESEMSAILSKSEKGKLTDEELKNYIENNKTRDYMFCLTDKEGKVLAGDRYGIKNIDLDKFYKPNSDKQVEIKVQVGEVRSNPAENKGYIKINDDRIVIYYYYGNIKEGDGNAFLILAVFSLFFIFLVRGRVKYIVKISKSIKLIAGGDLTERVDVKYKDELRDLGESINFMASELEKEDVRKKEFITNISHDLRTPLTTIMGYLKIIDEGKYKNQEELKGYLAIIDRKTNYLKSLLDDFFSYSKLCSKDMDIEMGVIYEQELLRQIVDEEERNFKERNLELTLTMEETPFYIRGNGELLERAINNLLSNAVKYSKSFTKVNINLNKQIINGVDYAVINVTSTPKEALDETEMSKLFERLYKKQASRTEEGSGLGLTITKEIMKAHNGFIKGDVVLNDVVFRLGVKLIDAQ